MVNCSKYKKDNCIYPCEWIIGTGCRKSRERRTSPEQGHQSPRHSSPRSVRRRSRAHRTPTRRNPSMESNIIFQTDYPDVIKEIYTYLTDISIQLCNIHDDGRINSIQDEDTIINLLRDKFKIKVPSARHWYDISVLDEVSNKWIPINIKVSRGSTDNALNKKAIVYSYTDITERSIPNNLNLNRMANLINTRLSSGRHTFKEYYYLYIDKIDNSVVIRSICDIQNFKSNPQNWLQIDWKKEKKSELHIFSIQQSYHNIMSVIATSLYKLIHTSDKIFDFLSLHDITILYNKIVDSYNTIKERSQ